MHFQQLSPIVNSFFSLLIITSLVLTFVMLGSRWLKNYILAFAIESWLIAILSAAVGYYFHLHDLYLIALLTIVFRGLLLPYLLVRMMGQLQARRELHSLVPASSSLMICAVFVIFAFIVAGHITTQLHETDPIILLALTIMLSMKLIAFLMLAVRDEAISKILGLLVLENGIFLGSQLLVPAMPILIELVILFDLLIVVVSFGVLLRNLHVFVGTTSARKLNRLVG